MIKMKPNNDAYWEGVRRNAAIRGREKLDYMSVLERTFQEERTGDGAAALAKLTDISLDFAGFTVIPMRQFQAAMDALSFFRSVIKSGEDWTDDCEKAYLAGRGLDERRKEAVR